MASKCGCAGNSCSCKVIAGRGAKVRGTGAPNNPIVIDAYPMSLGVETSTTVALYLSGVGTAGDPWKIRAETVAASAVKWKMWSGTQAQYNALAVKDNGTLYAITG